MKLVLYSGGQLRSNHVLHRAVIDLAREGKSKNKKLSLTYIPFCSENSNLFFSRAIRRYRPHGVEKFLCLNVDNSPSRSEIDAAFKSDIIYLSGGNTFYFLKHLRSSGVLDRLKTFAEKGGVIAGLSAGGLIMSPTVKSAADPGLVPDENEVNLRNFSALNLFQFEFSPHFESTPKLVKGHLEYSKKTKYPVYAVEDGAGIVIHGDEISVYGNLSVFFKGKRIIPR